LEIDAMNKKNQTAGWVARKKPFLQKESIHGSCEFSTNHQGR
jgi:hypothetical protein